VSQRQQTAVIWFGWLAAAAGVVTALAIVFTLTNLGVTGVVAALLPVSASTLVAFLTAFFRSIREAVATSAICAFASSGLSAWLLLDWSPVVVLETAIAAGVMYGAMAATIQTNLASRQRVR